MDIFFDKWPVIQQFGITGLLAFAVWWLNNDRQRLQKELIDERAKRELLQADRLDDAKVMTPLISKAVDVLTLVANRPQS